MSQTFLSVNVTYLKLFGMYPLEKSSSYLRKFWHYFAKYSSIFFNYFMFITVLLSIFIEKQELVNFTLTLLNIGIYFSSIVIMHIFQNNMVIIENVIDQMNCDFYLQTHRGVTEMSMKSTNKYVKMVSIYWYMSILTCGQIMSLFPLFSKGGNERFLAVPAWFPFNWKDSKETYAILFVIQCIGQFNLTSTYGVADTFIMSVLMTTGKQVELLGCNFENCVYAALLQLNVSYDDVLMFSQLFNKYGTTRVSVQGSSSENLKTIMSILRTKRFQAKLKRHLSACVLHHQNILKFIRRLEDFIWPLMTVKISASMFYHITICFILVCQNANKVFVYTLEQYEIMALYELFLVTYFGQYLIDKEENLQNQVYNCPWYVCDVDFQSSILIVLKGCLRTPCLSVARLAPLSFATLLAVLRISTSYFTVLRQVLEY